MGTEVVLHRSDVPAKFAEQMHMAQVLAESDLLPKHLRGRPANVLVILQGARALDVAGFWALQSLHVVDGKLGMAAELMRALVIRAGHRFTVIERTMDRAIVEIKRSDRDKAYRAEFSWQDAKDAELTAKDNWRKYRKSMLVARATSVAVRDECADVMFGVVYTPDELGATTDEEGAPIVDGSVVETLGDEEIGEAADALVNTPLEELPATWLRIVEHASTDSPVPEANGQTLTDWLVARLAIEAAACNSRAEVRRLWDLGQAMKVMNLIIARPEGEEPLEFGALLISTGATLPEQAPDPPTQAEVIVDGEVVGADTEHAEQMKAAAAASWTEKDLAAREQVFDELREMRENKERGQP